MSLIAIFLGYFLFAMMSAFGYNANESYVILAWAVGDADNGRVLWRQNH
jgi:hypothetical protein